MKKITLTTMALVLSVLIAAPAAFASSPVVDANAHIDIKGDHQGSGNDNLSAENDMHVNTQHNATSTAHMNAHASSTVSHRDNHGDNDASTTASSTDNGNGHLHLGELHRSVVASFVHSLLADADRDGGIGTQVRAIAQSQNDHASTTVDAMTKVEARSKLISFLFGTDWTSLSAVKASIVTTQHDISALQATLSTTTNATVRADLSAQIQVLQNEQARMQAFVDAHESGFSLLGWFTKLFAKHSDNS